MIKEKLKTVLNQYFWLIVIVFLIVVAVLTYLISSVSEQSKFNGTISNQTSQANKAVQEATNANASAANFDTTRRTEDAIREKTIEPKLDAARRKSQTSKIEVEKARKQLENEKLNLQNLNRDVAANCAELKQLFPDTTFQYCSGR